MTATPAFHAFKKTYEKECAQLVWRTLVSDLETPVSAYLKLAAKHKNSFLLESVEGGENLGRYSIIGMQPDIIWRCVNAKSEINRNATTKPGAYTSQDGVPFENLKRLFAESAIELPPEMPPMAAGVFGYLGYDMVRQIERLGRPPTGGLDTPDAIFIRPTIMAVFDNVRQEILLATPVRFMADVSSHDAYSAATDRIADAANALAAPLAHMTTTSSFPISPSEAPTSEIEPSIYCAMVDRAKEYIRAGDIFQVVLSQRFSAPFNADPFELYRSLRRSNPSPFLFYLAFDDFSIIGSSPEILVRVRDGEITIRPIAGTRPRGADHSEDAALADDLLADPKERAEHLMLLDLGRNDVARSAKIGSVHVTDSFQIERYSHVMHIVSNVVGELKSNIHALDSVTAGFPAGTVSGAPKVRAMQIIDELENSARGVYGGAIGYFSANGNVDTCIALRTAIVKGGMIHVQAGAGIVADSTPESEQRECENKAAALFSAAADAASRAAE